MLKKAQAMSINKDTYNRVNFYSIPSWVFEHMRKIESQGIKWKEHGYTIKGTSYEMFYRGDGLEVAQLIYPQHKKVKKEFVDIKTGEIISTIQDRTTSDKSNDMVSKIIHITNILLKNKQYTTEKELILYLSNEYKYKLTELQLKRMRGELESLGFKRIRANKEIKQKYGIESNGYPFLIIKNLI
jgi:hypothetical protein